MNRLGRQRDARRGRRSASASEQRRIGIGQPSSALTSRRPWARWAATCLSACAAPRFSVGGGTRTSITGPAFLSISRAASRKRSTSQGFRWGAPTWLRFRLPAGAAMADAATPGPAARRGSGAPSQGSRWGPPTWLRFLFVAPPVARAVALLAARRLWWGWDVRRDDTAGSGPDHSITGGCWLKLSTRRHVGGAGAKSSLRSSGPLRPPGNRAEPTRPLHRGVASECT